MNNLLIRIMDRNEVAWAVERAAIEGWNPGLHDADAFFAQDPGGFLVGELAGKPIGCISAVSYEQQFGFIGFYIVLPEFRGKGYGLQLWNAAVEKLNNMVIGLDGVMDQQVNYRKSGFRLEYSNLRFEYPYSPAALTPAEHIVPAQSVPFEQVLEYDRLVFRFPRPQFLKTWLHRPGGAAYVSIVDKRVCGYGVIRPCRVGFKIGPIFADSADIADDLFRALCATVPVQAPVFLDVPEPNQAGLQLAERYGMKKVFGTARMYRDGHPNLPVDRIFGVTTFELG